MNANAKWLTALALLAGPVVSNAALTYDYADDYLYDSSTGLYWQIGVVPTSTFVPSGGGQIATASQVTELFNEVGANGFSAAAYSIDIANLLSFFTTGAPAPPDSGTIPAESYELPLTAFSDAPAPGFDYLLASYSGGPSSPHALDWTFFTNATVGDYDIGNPYPDCGPSGNSTCPAQVNAFLISDVVPVPLPSSAWHLLLGVGGLGLMLRRQRKLSL